MRVYLGFCLVLLSRSLAICHGEETNSNGTCYEKIGCISKQNSPFAYLNIEPYSPEKLETSFLLYTRDNQDDAVVLDYLNETTFDTELFKSEKSLYVVVHGFSSSAKVDWMMDFKSALLKRDDCNVILVNWSKGAQITLGDLYTQAVVNLEVVAKQLTVTLSILHKKRQLKIETIHGIGHSLGAHVMGLAGQDMQRDFKMTLGRISGLDPAGPEFEHHPKDGRLSKDDASFVDVIHTSAGEGLTSGVLGPASGAYGLLQELGHVDFYVNGGTNPQPGCGSNIAIQFFTSGVTCSHARSHVLYLESLRQDNQNLDCQFTAYPCKDCDKCGDKGCGIMGIDSMDAPGRGKLYLKTNEESPFCKKSN